MRNKRKRGKRNNRGIDRDENIDGENNSMLEYRKNDSTPTSWVASILSFWQQQLLSMKWSEMYNEYVTYAKRMAQINEEFVKRSQRMTHLYIELSYDAQRMNELYKESIEITEAAYKNWLSACCSFWNKNELSPATVKEGKKDAQRTAIRNEEANLSNEEQKSINNMFKDSLTFD